MARRAVVGDPRITSKHGEKTNMGFFGRHLGYDYARAYPPGASVRSPEAGTITGVGNSGANSVGLYVYLDSNKYTHRFLHLSKQLVKVGDKVKEGQEIAKAGNSGVTTGPHLHHDTRKKGTAWNASFSNYVDWEAIIKNQPAPSEYPKWVKVKSKGGANVRSKPTTASGLAGSRYLPYLTPFRVKGRVKGQSINGNPYWYVSMYGNYVWTGNVT